MTRSRLALAALLAVSVGCYTVRYERRAVAETVPPRSEMHHAFVGGFFPGKPIELGAICPGGIVAVENELSVVDSLIQAAQIGTGVLALFHAPIWEPSTVRITCAKEGVSQPGANGVHRKLKIALMRLSPLGDVDPKTVALFSEALGGELRKRPGLSVMTESDVAALLGMEKTKAMLGCTDAGCIAEVGGALGVDRVVHGSVGRVGSSLLVNLSSLDSKKGVHAASVSERLKKATDEGFLDALPRIVDQLLAEPGR